MAEKKDLRVQKTHKFAYAALFELMEQKPFDDISVTDLCQKAMIHRTTFYNHFEDKSHLLRCALEAMQEEIIHKIPQMADPQVFFMAVLDRVLDHLYEKRFTYSRILRANNGGDVTRVFHRYIAQLLTEDLEYMEQKGVRHPSGIPSDALAEFYTGAFLSLACWWLENDLPISKDQFRHYVYELIQ